VKAEPRDPRSLALRHGAGIFAGFSLLSVTNAIAVAAAVPAPPSWSVRIARHALQIGETLGLGLLVAVVVAVPFMFARRRLGRAAVPVSMAVYGLACAFALQTVLKEFFERQSVLLLDGRFEDAAYPALLGLAGLSVPAAHLAGALLSRFRRLRWIGAALALASITATEVVARDDYFAIHAAAVWIAAVFAGMLFSPEAERLALYAWSRPRGRLAVGAVLLTGALGVAVPPGNLVRIELFRDPCVIAPWIFARVLWGTPAAPASRAEAGDRWTSSRSNDPPVSPTAPPLVESANLVVVLITVDALRGDVVNDQKYESLFPTIAKLKRTGTTFVNATSAGSQTSASLTALFSGKSYSEVPWTRYGSGRLRFYYPNSMTSSRFPDSLLSRNVATASFLGVSFLESHYGIAGGFAEETSLVQGRQHASSNKVFDSLLKRLDRAKKGDRLFLYAHVMDVHEPYNLGRKDGAPFERYVSEITVVDQEVGRVLTALEERFEGRFVLIVSADHGEAFGEHGTTFHSKTLYNELLHVPLFVRTPIVSSRVVTTRVGLLDVGPTILDLYGVSTPARFLGRSLVPLLQGHDKPLDRPLFAEGRLRRALIRPDGMKVIEDLRRKTIEAYDLARDPRELDNVWENDPRAHEAIAALRAYFETNQLLPADKTPYKH
jgi:hypothetical protein